jgi:CO dehydrogenase maturation factor
VGDLAVPNKMVVAAEGGSGKSTITTLIARLALKKGRRVMVVDADESNLGIQRMTGSSWPISEST